MDSAHGEGSDRPAQDGAAKKLIAHAEWHFGKAIAPSPKARLEAVRLKKEALERGERPAADDRARGKEAPPLAFRENALAWEIFEDVKTQKILAVGMSAQLLGLSQDAITQQLELRGVPVEKRLEIFRSVQILASYYVAHWNRKSESKEPPKGRRKKR